MMSAISMADTMPYIPPESKPTKPKRRSFTAEQKKTIAEEALAAGASVSRIARAHDLNTNQVFKWMREYQRANSGTGQTAQKLLPVLLSPPLESFETSAVSEKHAMAATGTIELHLARGRICLTGSVDANSLRIVLDYLAS
jgi:transposase